MLALLTVLGSILLTALLLLGIAVAARRDAETEAARRPVTMAELDPAEAALREATLPMARITTVPGAGGVSRIGGVPSADPEGRGWPIARDGTPVAFLAQIDFSEMPPLTDFPGHGTIQVFIAGEGDPVAHVVRWLPGGADEGAMAPPLEPVPESFVLTFSHRAATDGLPLRFAVGEAAGNPFNWPFEDVVPWQSHRPAVDDAVRARLDGAEDRHRARVDAYGTHWIGGHPDFVQSDVRYDEALRHLDRVLLHLGYDDDVLIGDSGTLNLMISAGDLRARRFDRTYLAIDSC